MLVLNGVGVSERMFPTFFRQLFLLLPIHPHFPKKQATGRPFFESPRLVTFRDRKAVSVYASHVYIQDQR